MDAFNQQQPPQSPPQEPSSEPSAPQPSTKSYSVAMLSVIVGAFIIIAALVGWYFYSSKGIQEEDQVTTSEEQSTGLGAELFEDVNNPIEDQIPTVQTTVNPIENIYKNPFE